MQHIPIAPEEEKMDAAFEPATPAGDSLKSLEGGQLARAGVSDRLGARAVHGSAEGRAKDRKRTHDDHAVRRRFRFWRHFVEMVIAMAAGMAALGVPFRAILTSLGYSWDEAVIRLPEIVCVVMTFNMSVGMVAWMRLRGHGWRASLEMTLAMYAATAIALVMFWLHIVSQEPLLGLMHVLMLPAMLVTMLYRRDEYAYAHH